MMQGSCDKGAMCLVGVVLMLALASCGGSAGDIFSGLVVEANTTPTPLPDGAMPGAQYPSPIVVSTPNTSITSVLIALNVTHERAQDLDVLLVGPGGQKVMLMSDCLGNWSLSTDVFLFSDDAVTPVPTATVAPPGGSLMPTDHDPVGDPDTFYAPAPPPPYSSNLGVFLGTNPNGTWRLYIYDDTANGTAVGQLAAWQIWLNTE